MQQPHGSTVASRKSLGLSGRPEPSASYQHASPTGAAWLDIGDASPDEAGLEHPAVHGREAFLDARRQKADMRDAGQVVGNLPEVFLASHPVDGVEAREIDGPRVAAQRLLPAQVEVRLEVGEDERADCRVDRLAKAKARVIRTRDRAQATVLPEDRENVIVVINRLEIQEKRGMPLHAQGRGGKESAVHALHRAFAQDPSGRAATRAGNVVVEAVQELLDAPGGSQAEEEPSLPRCQTQIPRGLLDPLAPARIMPVFRDIRRGRWCAIETGTLEEEDANHRAMEEALLRGGDGGDPSRRLPEVGERVRPPYDCRAGSSPTSSLRLHRHPEGERSRGVRLPWLRLGAR